jgi:hypothetical protein
MWEEDHLGVAGRPARSRRPDGLAMRVHCGSEELPVLRNLGPIRVTHGGVAELRLEIALQRGCLGANLERVLSRCKEGKLAS